MATEPLIMIGTVTRGGSSERRLADGYDLERLVFTTLPVSRISIADPSQAPRASHEDVPFAEYVPDDPSVLPAEVRAAWEVERRNRTVR